MTFMINRHRCHWNRSLCHPIKLSALKILSTVESLSSLPAISASSKMVFRVSLVEIGRRWFIKPLGFIFLIFHALWVIFEATSAVRVIICKTRENGSISRDNWRVLEHQLPPFWLPPPCNIRGAFLGKYWGLKDIMTSLVNLHDTQWWVFWYLFTSIFED